VRKSLLCQHRAIETGLDSLAQAIVTRNLAPPFFAVLPEIEAHYRFEEKFLARLARTSPAVAAKMASQHAEVIEIAEHLKSALESRNDRDALALARRFLAMAHHNIIEEERDVFPVAGDSLL
jgi:hypothetical protein